MALYILTCPDCGATQRRILKSADEVAFIKCKTENCDAYMKRQTTPPTVHTKEVLAFSHQVKNVERFTDSEELYDERAHMDPRKPT